LGTDVVNNSGGDFSYFTPCSEGIPMEGVGYIIRKIGFLINISKYNSNNSLVDFSRGIFLLLA